MFKAMTIAGSDTSGGAGMQADIKTFQEMGVYGMVALTCIVAQNPANDWAHDVFPLETELIKKQLATIMDGIGCDAMKTGMLGSASLVELVAETIDKYKLENVVIDPVMVCKGVDEIMVPEAAAAIKELLVKRALVMTPNLLEAAYLADMPEIKNVDDMKAAAEKIHAAGCRNVIIKAGDRFAGNVALDIIFNGKEFVEKRHTKLDGCFNHGAGCTFSAAITAGLAKGYSVEESLDMAERFIAAALHDSFRLNGYAGAVKHCAWREWAAR